MYKIGELSKLTEVPVKTIRYYDELGLLAPSFIDKYTCYRYYDETNMQKLFQIIFLKKLGYSLEEIKHFNLDSLNEQKKVLEEMISESKNKLHLINSLQKMKGEIIMKPFINDEQAIGKWNYIASTISIQDYEAGDFYNDKDVAFKELYFLDGGMGYWVFDRWTKGIIYHFEGRIYKYTIKNNNLFLEIYSPNGEYEITLVYERENSNHYDINDIKLKDNVDLPFIDDEKLAGFWKACDFIEYSKKDSYIPEDNHVEYYLRYLVVKPNGECFFELDDKNIWKINWTKGSILDKKNSINFNYIIKEKDGDLYLIMDWKSGDYTFGKKIHGCYVFKKEN